MKIAQSSDGSGILPLVRTMIAALLVLAATSVRGEERRAVTLEEARAAAARAPSRRAAAGRTQAAGYAVEAAGAWPAFAVGAATSWSTARAVLTAAIPLPIFGTVGAATDVARAELDVARAEEGALDLDLRRRVTQAWLELARAEARAARADEIAANAAKLADTAHKRFDAGDAPRAEVVAADAANARAKADARAAHDAIDADSAGLAAELAWNPEAPLHAEPGLPPPVDPPPVADLIARARAHPEVRGAAAKEAREAARVTQAQRARLPSVSLTGEADIDDPTLPGNDFKVGLALDVPLLSKGGDAVRAAEAARRAAALDREATSRSLEGRIVAAYRRYQAAATRARTLVAEVVPAQRAAAELARTAYREGQGRLMEVLAADRALAEIEVEAIDAAADAAVARAELEQAAGGGF